MINGYYEPIDEFAGNASVYKKLGDEVQWIEYSRNTGKWYVRSTGSRGTDKGRATAAISPPRCLEDCPLSCWQIGDGVGWVSQPSFSVTVSSRESFEAAYFAEVCILTHKYSYIETRKYVLITNF